MRGSYGGWIDMDDTFVAKVDPSQTMLDPFLRADCGFSFVRVSSEPLVLVLPSDPAWASGPTTER